MNEKATSKQALNALEQYKQAAYVEGYRSVRNTIYRVSNGYMIIVDVAHYGTFERRFPTLKAIREAAAIIEKGKTQ